MSTKDIHEHLFEIIVDNYSRKEIFSRLEDFYWEMGREEGRNRIESIFNSNTSINKTEKEIRIYSKYREHETNFVWSKTDHYSWLSLTFASIALNEFSDIYYEKLEAIYFISHIFDIPVTGKQLTSHAL